MRRARSGKTVLLLLILAVSCSRRARGPISAPVIGGQRDDFSRCAIDAEAWTTAIDVTPAAGAPSLSVRAEHAQLSVDARGAWEARVAAPLSFRGATEEPDLVTARAVDNGPLLHLEVGRNVESVRSDRSALVARAWLASRDDEPGTLEIFVDDVRLECADLHAGRTDDEGAEHRQRPVDLWSPVQMADLGFLELRDGGGRIVVQGDGLFVHVLERDGERARVVLQWSDGSRVRGWAARTALRDPEPEETLAIGRAMGGLAELDVGAAVPLSAWALPSSGRGWGLRRFGSLGRFARARTAPRPLDARIVRGTPVYAAPGRGRWATVSADAIFGVSAQPSCEWALLQRAPGLDLPPLRAWVRADALVLSAEP